MEQKNLKENIKEVVEEELASNELELVNRESFEEQDHNSAKEKLATIVNMKNEELYLYNKYRVIVKNIMKATSIYNIRKT